MVWDPGLFEKASRFAADKHGSQKVPGTNLPYLLHLIQVCNRAVRAAELDPSLDGNMIMQCALLHDVIEDGATTDEEKSLMRDEIKKMFGSQIADGVSALSKVDSFHSDGLLDKGAMMADSLQRILKQPKEVWVVKMADRITNLQSPPSYWTLSKKKYYLNEAKEIYKALHSSSVLLANEMKVRMAEYEVFVQ